MKNLDPLLDAANEGEHIFLGACRYTTTGCGGAGSSHRLKIGVKLIGLGRGVTVIEMIPDKTREMTVILGSDNNTVQDLTIDGACDNPREEYSKFKTNGVFLFGSNHTITGVEVIRVFGNYKCGQECFGIMAHGKSRIENCQVRQICGTYVSAICGCGGSVTNCSSIFPEVLAQPDRENFHMGFNCGPGLNLIVTGNISVNAKSGFYSDWDNTDNLQVYANSFFNCRHAGVLVKMQYVVNADGTPQPPQMYKNAKFSKNHIELDCETTYHLCAFMFDNTRQVYSEVPICHGGIQDIEVSENIVTMRDAKCIAEHRQFTNIASLCPTPSEESGCRGFTFRDNSYPKDFTWRQKNAADVHNYRLEKEEVPITWS